VVKSAIGTSSFTEEHRRLFKMPRFAGAAGLEKDLDW
jgi:hypothetical protein